MAGEAKKRVDPTAAERKRRFNERRRAEKEARERFGNVPKLSAAALMAEKEVRESLGEDFGRFGAAVRDYVLAVDNAEHARAVWIEGGRQMRDTFANGMGGVHPHFKAMEAAMAQSMRLRGELGLSPASARRINGAGVRGRPVGAVSAADRKAEAPKLKLA